MESTMVYTMIIFGIIFIFLGSYCLKKCYNKNTWIAAFVKIAAISLPVITVCSVQDIMGNSSMSFEVINGTDIVMSMMIIGKMFCERSCLYDNERRDILSGLAYGVSVFVILLFLAGNYGIKQNTKTYITWTDGVILIAIAGIFFVVSVLKNRDQTEWVALCKTDILMLLAGIVFDIAGGILISVRAYRYPVMLGMTQKKFASVIFPLIIFVPQLIAYYSKLHANFIIACQQKTFGKSCNATSDKLHLDNKSADLRKQNVSYKESEIIAISINICLLTIGISALIKDIRINIYNLYDIMFIPIVYFIVWILVKCERVKERVIGCTILTMYLAYIIFTFGVL